MINLRAFSEELAKIAAVKPNPIAIRNAMHLGWHGGGVEGTGWMLGHSGIRAKLPLGAKSLTVGGAALMAPGAIARQDPSGENRSRAERVSELGANTAGGIYGAGALMGTRFGIKHPLLAGGIGGVGGALGAEGVVRKLMRRRRPNPPIQQEEKSDEIWRGQQPAHSPPAAEGQQSLL